MKTLHLSFLLVSSFVIVACANTTTPSKQTNETQYSANTFQPPAGKAGLYIFEEGSLIRADNSHRVFLNGLALGIVSSSSFLYATLSPGPHTITLENSKVTITAVAGQNYFVREKTHLDAGGQILTSTLSMETPAKAIPLIKELETME